MKRIDIDYRENSEILIDSLQSEYQFEVNLIALKYGDYFIAPDTFVELKKRLQVSLA